MSIRQLVTRRSLFQHPSSFINLCWKNQHAITYHTSASSQVESLSKLSSVLTFGKNNTSDSTIPIGELSDTNKNNAETPSYTLKQTKEQCKPPLLDSNKITSDGVISPNENSLLNKDGIFKDITWQMHVYAHRHNVHITVARPPAWRHPITGKVYGENPPSRSVALSLSAGRLGLKHSGRKNYDSAFQLGTYVMARMQESGMNSYIQKLEVYLRGFGAGREAVTRVLLGVEGKHLRHKIVKVADSTRLKIGGSRSANPRRLG